MNLFRGSWNVVDDEVLVHSPVRLLQKLAAYRASSGSNSASVSPSPSPLNERKSTILTEPSNFFTRLWRPNAHHPTPSPTLIASHEATSSSFDHISEPGLAPTETSSPGLSPSPRLNRRISFIREVSSKPQPQLHAFSPPPLQPRPTTSSIVTDPSFEDTTSEQPCDTASEFCSQSFETNIDSSNPGILDDQDEKENYRQQQGLTYNERQRRLSLSAHPVIPLIQQLPSLPIRTTEQQHHSDSLASPEANIDASMVSFSYLQARYYFTYL
jgi:hypothetical protein